MWRLELRDDQFVLCSASESVIVCYSSRRKPIQSVHKLSVLFQKHQLLHPPMASLCHYASKVPFQKQKSSIIHAHQVEINKCNDNTCSRGPSATVAQKTPSVRIRLRHRPPFPSSGSHPDRPPTSSIWKKSWSRLHSHAAVGVFMGEVWSLAAPQSMFAGGGETGVGLSLHRDHTALQGKVCFSEWQVQSQWLLGICPQDVLWQLVAPLWFFFFLNRDSKSSNT